jgi:hypothetical protein
MLPLPSPDGRLANSELKNCERDGEIQKETVSAMAGWAPKPGQIQKDATEEREAENGKKKTSPNISDPKFHDRREGEIWQFQEVRTSEPEGKAENYLYKNERKLRQENGYAARYSETQSVLSARETRGQFWDAETAEDGDLQERRGCAMWSEKAQEESSLTNCEMNALKEIWRTIENTVQCTETVQKSLPSSERDNLLLNAEQGQTTKNLSRSDSASTNHIVDGLHSATEDNASLGSTNATAAASNHGGVLYPPVVSPDAESAATVKASGDGVAMMVIQESMTDGELERFIHNILQTPVPVSNHEDSAVVACSSTITRDDPDDEASQCPGPRSTIKSSKSVRGGHNGGVCRDVLKPSFGSDPNEKLTGSSSQTYDIVKGDVFRISPMPPSYGSDPTQRSPAHL